MARLLHRMAPRLSVACLLQLCPWLLISWHDLCQGNLVGPGQRAAFPADLTIVDIGRWQRMSPDCHRLVHVCHLMADTTFWMAALNFSCDAVIQHRSNKLRLCTHHAEVSSKSGERQQVPGLQLRQLLLAYCNCMLLGLKGLQHLLKAACFTTR